MRGFRVFTCALAGLAAALLLAGGSALGFGPAAVPNVWVVSGGSTGGGTVNSVATVGSTAYLGGNFSYLGPAKGSSAGFDTSSDTPNATWPAIAGSVYSIVSDGNNGWYVGGDFNSVGGDHYENLVHIKSDGTVDTAWQATANGPVYTLVLSGATLYAGGGFTKANAGQTRNHLAAFTASTGALVAAFHPDVTGPNSFVWSMTIFGSDIFFGGLFNTVQGQTRNNAAAVATSDGDLDNWNPNTNDTVYAVANNGGTIYIGGKFSLVGGQSRAGLAAISTNGTLSTSWTPNPNPGNVFSLAVSGAPAVVYVGGSFTTIGGATRPALAGIDSFTGNATTWNPGLTAGASAVYHLVVNGDGNAYAGGFFQSVNGNAQTKDNLAAFSTSGPSAGTATSWHPVVGGSVYGLAVSGTKVAAGGQFRTVGPQVVRRNNLGAIDLTTGQATSWAPYADNSVNAVAASGSTIYVGGLFEHVTDVSHPLNLFPRQALAAFDAGSGAVLPWDPELDDGTVSALAVDGSTIYAGGTFTRVFDPSEGAGDFVTRNRLASFDSDGLVSGWDPNMGNEVQALAVSGSNVYAGGSFTTVNGSAPRSHLAAIDKTTGFATNFTPDLNGDVNALAVSSSTVYAGGSFTAANGSTRWGAAAFEASGGGGELRTESAQNAGDLTAWDPHLERISGATRVAGTVNALANAGATVYLGGDFDYIGTCAAVACQGAAGAVSATSGALAANWLPEPNATVNAITLGPDGVLLGGLFTAVGYPRPGGAFATPEPNAAVRGGFSLFRGLPEPPANVAVSPRDGGATVTFGASPFTGGAAITQYTVTANPGNHTASSGGSPIQVDGLSNGTEYTFTVTSTNSVGVGQPSAPLTATPAPVPTAPGAPTNVQGAPGNGQVSVSFAAPSNGGSPITSYTVTSTPGGIVGTGTSSPIVVSGLTNGQAYSFTVKATNAIGTGPDSAPSSQVTPRTVPGAPTGVTAVPGNGQVTINFSAPASNGGSPILGYTVTSSPDGRTASGVGSPITVTGLDNGQSYTFIVTAANTAGTGPASSPSNAATPRTIPGAPTGVTAAPGNTSALVSFNAPADNGGDEVIDYTVISSGGQSATGGESPIPVGGLINGQSYTFTVRATNHAGDGPLSAPSNAVTPRTVPGAPTGLIVTPGNGQVTINYSAPVSDGGSAITQFTATSSPDNHTGTSNDGTPIVVGGLTNGSSYVFTVTASNIAGVGPPSATSSPVTPRTVPGAPTMIGATAANGQATVAFTPPDSDGGAPIATYTVTSSPGNFEGTGTTSPIVVFGLTNGVPYTFTVKANNDAGAGAASAASSAVTPGVPPTAPAPPNGVSAVAGSGQATVSFTPQGTGGSPITSFTVTSSPGNFTGTGSASPILVSGLTNGVAYTFTVTATNSVGTSAPSGPSSPVTPVAGSTAPGAPTGATATAGNGQATVAFTAPASNGGSAITAYTVTSSPGNRTATGPASPLTVTGLTNGQAYTFTVTATNAIGISQPSSPSNVVTPGFVPVAPGAPTAVAATAGNKLAVVTFTPPVSNGGAAITGYTVTVSPGGATVNGTGSPIIVTGLTNGQGYTFTVTASNSAGTSAASAASTAVTPVLAERSAPPSPPAAAPRPDVPAVPPQSNPRQPPPSH